jgi:hypothetical protein
MLSDALGNRLSRCGAPRPWPRTQPTSTARREPAYSVIPAAIVLIVAVSMGIGAALLGYPAWAIPLIALFGAGGAIVAVRVLG